MLSQILFLFEQANDFFLGYVALVLIGLLGGYFSIRTRFFQLRNLPEIGRTFFGFLRPSPKEEKEAENAPEALGTHPLKAFFASVGGMIGIGNVVAITTAVTVGGPGSLLWVWLVAIIGSLIKYSEIYLGHKFRVPNSKGGYDGGPMYFLRHAFPWKWVAPVVCVLLCIYGTEIYQFSVMVHSITENFQVDRTPIIVGLLALVLYASVGGVARVGKVCSILMPFFTSAYLLMCGWVFLKNWGLLPEILREVFTSAFSGHAAVGGFAGSSVLMGLQQGAARAAYSSDIGIGYDSIIQSESATADSTKQARLSILGVVIDNLVCTCSILIILVTGVWKAADPIPGSQMIQTALSLYFPGMSLFMPIFLFILGYTTVIAYLCVCLKCARFLNSKYGVWVYLVFAIPTLVVFSFQDQSHALLVMSVAQSLLLMLNLTGIFRLRNEIEFREEPVISVNLIKKMRSTAASH